MSTTARPNGYPPLIWGRAEFFNFFNHTVFRRPNTSFGNYNFGNITAAESARIGQLGLKLHF